MIFIIIGYLFGSIPFGWVIAKINKIDIQKQGSGNTGATNVSRVLGFKYALLVGILDVSKAVLPALIAKHYLNNEWFIALAMIAPIIGHIFPVWLKFKGGKAVSTIFASIIVILGWKYSLMLLIVWIIALRTIKIMSLTNLIIIWFIPLIFWYQTHSFAYLTLGLIYIPLIYWAHRENIERLKNGTEKRIIK
ncbi:MAG: glycerol-3-phosphate 1-O-acyltransferase PlsY [Candidatus Pacebacteria bacterium]|nr:glycerol-3-phosphate 1-O-acyltransferase PlsY [Candidatus Paceibacterota bacterium]